MNGAPFLLCGFSLLSLSHLLPAFEVGWLLLSDQTKALSVVCVSSALRVQRVSEVCGCSLEKAVLVLCMGLCIDR